MSRVPCVTAVVLLTVFQPGAAFGRRKKPEPLPPPSLAAVVEPKANEVCFSPEEPCELKLVQFLLGAKKSLDVAIYDINLDQLVHVLAVAAKRMPVRVVVDLRQSRGGHSLAGSLGRLGVGVRIGRQRGIMHNKFVIRDGTMLETGSFNYTHHAATANNENQVYLDTPAVIARFSARFEQIWQAAQPLGERPAPPPGEPPNASDDSTPDSPD